MAGFSEHDFLHHLRTSTAPDARLRVPIGDDAAVAAANVVGDVLAVDAVMEGVHVASGPEAPEQLARKAVRSNVSDIAAMGARPSLALMTLVLPTTATRDVADRVAAVTATECRRFGAVLCGGDTVVGGDRMIVSVTLTGQLIDEPVTRSGARPGELLVVTGALGGSLSGRHVDISPRLEEAAELIRLGPPSAMTDVSDGLLRDAANLATSSGCGVIVRGQAVPIHPDAERRAATTGLEAQQHALHDGEDFELLFTVGPDAWMRIQEKWKLETPLTVIGQVVADGLWFESGDRCACVAPGGWNHGESISGDR